RTSIAIIAACQVGAMALWFSASAVLPALIAQYSLPNFMQAARTRAVRAGFVVGCLVSAVLGLADRIAPRRFIAVSAFAGAVANALFLTVDPTSFAAPMLRFFTGVGPGRGFPGRDKSAADRGT